MHTLLFGLRLLWSVWADLVRLTLARWPAPQLTILVIVVATVALSVWYHQPDLLSFTQAPTSPTSTLPSYPTPPLGLIQPHVTLSWPLDRALAQDQLAALDELSPLPQRDILIQRGLLSWLQGNKEQALQLWAIAWWLDPSAPALQPLRNQLPQPQQPSF